MIRVLHCLGGLGTGGTETLIMNWYREIDRSRFQFDFLVRNQDKNYYQEIIEMGGNVYFSSAFPRHFIKNFFETMHVLKKGKWNVVHVHGNAALYLTVLVLAKFYNIPCRIMHSHSTSTRNGIYKCIHYLNRALVPFFATEKLACSSEAGIWMFGNRSFKVLRNGIDIESFVYDDQKRNRIRSEYRIEDKFVVGHVGRFALPKNHRFLIEVFSLIKRKRNDAVLFLVGDGELEKDIRDYVKKLNLDDCVIFTGRKSNVGEMLSAMDCFVFPSLWEGLSIALIEAQMNGLPCFVSEEVIKGEVCITNMLYPISFKKEAFIWADLIVNNTYESVCRTQDQNILRQSGYDITTIVNELQDIYIRSGKSES